MNENGYKTAVFLMTPFLCSFTFNYINIQKINNINNKISN